MTIRSVLITAAAVALALATTNVNAQQPTSPQAGATEASVTLTVTQSELAVIGKALGKLPFEEVAGLFQKLQQQVSSAQAKPPSAPTPESGK